MSKKYQRALNIPEIEYKTAAEIKQFQEKLLREHLEYLNKNSRFYQKHFRKYGIDTGKIRTLEDLAFIPPVSKQDLQNNFKSFICVPEKKIIDYITTTGTSGDPVTFITTENDLERLAYNEGISFIGAGITDEDVIQLTVTLDKRFMAGLAYFLGARKIGAGVVRVGSGIPELQWDTVRRVRSTVLIGVPSFILKLIEYAEAKGIDYKKSTVKKAICIGEPIRNNDFSLNTLGRRIREKWDIELYSTYASTEMSSAFTECSAGRGGHLHPDLLIVEFLGENNQPVEEVEHFLGVGVFFGAFKEKQAADLAFALNGHYQDGFGILAKGLYIQGFSHIHYYGLPRPYCLLCPGAFTDW